MAYVTSATTQGGRNGPRPNAGHAPISALAWPRPKGNRRCRRRAQIPEHLFSRLGYSSLLRPAALSWIRKKYYGPRRFQAAPG